ncbi:MAG: DNA-directed DNA polymerase [Pseudomonadota bacterium]
MDSSTSAPPLPPWLGALRDRLVARGRAGRLPHGLLVRGVSGVGKSLLSVNLMQSLLCERACDQDPPCNRCNSCRSLAGGVHPEVWLLEPEEPGKPILVDAVRDASEFLALSGGSEGLRAVRICPADSLNPQAANALLKTLEEPPQGALLILEAAQPARLPATIRSRCEDVEVATPALDQVRDWLRPLAPDEAAVEEVYAAALGRPLAARELLTDPERMAAWEQDREVLRQLLSARAVTPLAAALQRSLPETLVPRLQALLLSAQRLLSTGEPDAFASRFPRSEFEAFAHRHGARGLAILATRASRWQRQLSVSLNPSLRMEDIALAFLPENPR